MTLFVQSIHSVLLAELFLAIISSGFFFFELKTLNVNLQNKSTVELIGFLLSLNLTYFMRVIGILSDSIVIRTYLTGVIALIGGMLFIIWGVTLSESKRWKVNLSYTCLILGMILFLDGRYNNRMLFSRLGLIIMILGPLIIMTMIFRYVFSSSPYVRARHRLFVLTLSFLFYAIFEGFAVANLGSKNYLMAALFFILVLPWRFGMTLSIMLPPNLTNFLFKFIH